MVHLWSGLWRNHRYLVLSLLVAAITGALAYSYLQELDARVDVVVAARDLPERAQLDSEAVRVVSLPAAAVHAAAVRRTEDAVGRYLAAPVAEGEVLLAHRLSDQGTHGALLAALDGHHRAIFVATSLAQGVGAAVRPRDRVDVIFVPDEQRAGVAGARTLLRQVTVLDVRDDRGASLQGGSEDAELAGVILRVPAKEAEKLALAMEYGKLYLSLTGPGTQPAATPGASLTELVGALIGSQPAPLPDSVLGPGGVP